MAVGYGWDKSDPLVNCVSHPCRMGLIWRGLPLSFFLLSLPSPSVRRVSNTVADVIANGQPTSRRRLPGWLEVNPIAIPIAIRAT